MLFHTEFENGPSKQRFGLDRAVELIDVTLVADVYLKSVSSIHVVGMCIVCVNIN